MTKKYKRRKAIIQDHNALAIRYQAMADSINRKETRVPALTDEQKAARAALQLQADEHFRKVFIFRKTSFVMIL
jgi:hypothetical protein